MSKKRNWKKYWKINNTEFFFLKWRNESSDRKTTLCSRESYRKHLTPKHSLMKLMNIKNKERILHWLGGNSKGSQTSLLPDSVARGNEEMFPKFWVEKKEWLGIIFNLFKWSIYSVVFISAIRQSDSDIYICSFFSYSFPLWFHWILNIFPCAKQ